MSPEVLSLTFPAMGCTARVTLVDADALLLTIARRRIEQLESRWSRFRNTSDITRLNTSPGVSVSVSSDTILLVAHLIESHRLTSGMFDPTMLPTSMALGDSTSILDDSVITHLDDSARSRQNMDDIVIDAQTNSVTLPTGLSLDPGGLGKGLASDLVATELMSMGARGVCVNLGGDMRCIGDSGDHRGWVVDIMDADDHDSAVARVAISDGAVATSTTRARRWTNESVQRHHIIDPRLSRPTDEFEHSLQLSTVVAATAAWAETLTKAILVLGWDAGSTLASQHGIAAFAVDNSGCRHANEQWKTVER